MSVAISAEPSLLIAALRDLLEHLPKLSFELRQLALDRLDAIVQAGWVHAEALPATCAAEVRVSLEPTDALLDLVVAVRAGNV